MVERKRRSFLIPASLDGALDIPARVRVQANSFIAVTGGPGELLVADLTSPLLHLKSGSSQASDAVVSRMEVISTTTPEPADFWQSVVDGHEQVAPLSADLVPGGDTWSTLGRIDSVRLNVSVKGRPLVVTYLPSNTVASASERCLELLRIMIPLAKKCKEAQDATLVVFQGQQIELVSPRLEHPTRRVGAAAAPTRLPSGGDVYVVWNRDRAGQPTFVVESNALSFRTERRVGDQQMPTPTARIIDACATLGQQVPRSPLGPGLYSLASTETSAADRVPDVTIECLRGEWAIRSDVFRGPDGDDRAGGRFLLTDGKKLMLIDLGRSVTVDELSSLLANLGQRSQHTAIRSQGPLSAVSPDWPGLRAAVDNTLARIGSDAPSDLPQEPHPQEVDAAVTALAAEGPSARTPLSRALVRAIAERRGGLELLTSRHLRWLCHDVPPIERAGRAAEFADALTANLAAVAVAGGETPREARQFVVRSVCDWLQSRLSASDSLTTDMILGVARHDWQRLLARAPWLIWFSATDPPRGHRVHLSVEALAASLTLLRPRQDTRPNPFTRGRHVFPSRWWNLFVMDSAPELDGRRLLELATCFESALIDPMTCSRAVQGMRLSDTVRAQLLDWLDQAGATVGESGSLLAVHTGGSDSPVLLLNASATGPLNLTVDGQDIRLPPRAVESHGAVDYELGDLIDRGAEVVMGSARFELASTDPGIAEGVSFTDYAVGKWFRGRTYEIARLAFALERHERRPASLVFGPRRAGKSTLAWHLGEDPRAVGRVLIDLGNTPMSVRDFRDWNAAVIRQLERQARLNLGVTDPLGSDFVDALVSLDDLVGTRSPVVLVLDELDVLLADGGDGSARRAAGRLGATAFRNLAVVGAAQRFHHSAQEFKSWQPVECPADLRWADGVTYFLEPLARESDAPRSECLRRSAASVRAFSETISARAGLRPYFWGQLRSRMEGYVRGNESAPRLIGREQLNAFLSDIVRGDPHLASVFDRGEGLAPEEIQRRDLFTRQERSILARFADLPKSQHTIALQTALAAGGSDALTSLLDRAFLKMSPGERVETAVPLYLEFLRARTRELLEVLDVEGLDAEGADSSPDEENPRTWHLPVGAIGDDSITEIRARIDKALRGRDYITVGGLVPQLRGLVPGPNWAGYESFTEWLTTTFPDLPVTRHPYAEGTVWRDSELIGMETTPMLLGSVAVTDLRSVIAEVLGPRDYVAVAELGNVLGRRFPELKIPGKFTKWFKAVCPEYQITDSPYKEGTVWRPEGADVHGGTTLFNGTELDRIRGAVRNALGARACMSAAGLRAELLQQIPDLAIVGKFTRWLQSVVPEFPLSVSPFAEGTVWRDTAAREEAGVQQDLTGFGGDRAEGGRASRVNSVVGSSAIAVVRARVDKVFADTVCVAGGWLGNHLRDAVPPPKWGGGLLKDFLATVCPELAHGNFPFHTGTFWRSSADMQRAFLRISGGVSDTNPFAALLEAAEAPAFDAALRRHVSETVAIAGELRTAQFNRQLDWRARFGGDPGAQTAADWLALNTPELRLSGGGILLAQPVVPEQSESASQAEREAEPQDQGLVDGVDAAVLEVAVGFISSLVRASSEPVPILNAGAKLKAAGISLKRTESGVSPFSLILKAIEAETDIVVLRTVNKGCLWIPGKHEPPTA